MFSKTPVVPAMQLNICAESGAVLQRYSPIGGFQSYRNDVRIAHYQINRSADTAGFIAIFGEAGYSYEKIPCVGFFGESSHVISHEFAGHIALCLMKQSSFLLLSFLLILGCSAANPSISEQITKQFKASQTASVDLSAVGPASWERVCILSPYSTNQSAEQVLGFKWDAESKTSIAGSDGINVLVFVQDHRVVAYTEHPRNLGDFSKLQPPCLVRSQATVNRESDVSGWVFLVAR